MNNKLRRTYWNIFLFILANLLFCLEHPNFININGFGFLAWISYIPILFLIKNINTRQSLILGFLYGITSYLLFSYWLFNHSIAALGFALLLCSIEYSLFFFLLKIQDNFSAKYGWFFQFIIACGFEYLKTRTFVGNSYGLPAYSQWQFTKLIQITDIIGVYGFSFFIMLPSFFIYSFIQKLLDKKNIKTNRDSDNNLYECTTHLNYISKYEIQLKSTSVILPILVFLMWCGCAYFVIDYGFNLNAEYDECDIKKLALIQHNPIDKEQTYDIYKKDSIKLMTLTDEAKEMYSDIDLFVWPETAIIPELVSQIDVDSDSLDYQLSQNVLNYIISNRTPLLLGNAYSTVSNNKVEKFNSALFFDKTNGSNPYIYKKIHLVPLSEYIPYVSNFEVINKFLKSNQMNMWTPGNDIKIFRLGDFDFSVPICFEDTFPDIPRKMVEKGSRCFINISNDSWGKSKVCQYQHLSMSVFRAVENKIPMVKCSSSGQSCFITPSGNITLMAEPFISTYICGDVIVLGNKYKQTFFTKYGDIAGFSVFIFTIALLLIQSIIGIIKIIKNKSQVEKNG